ncbi:MAG: hypothetical protein H0U81_06240 [Pyrinomonadaceae bacterium]|nr:hypothetical protein [Pyrinomonadaceae bacterium]
MYFARDGEKVPGSERANRSPHGDMFPGTFSGMAGKGKSPAISTPGFPASHVVGAAKNSSSRARPVLGREVIERRPSISSGA